MVYTARWSDELTTPRERKRDQETANRHKFEADKIAVGFFQKTLGFSDAQALPCNSGDHDHKVIRVDRQDGMFCVYHRGHAIRVQGDYDSLLPKLEEWRKANMSHARIRADKPKHN